MSIEKLPAEMRQSDYFHHIDMGFLNRRLCLSELPNEIRLDYIDNIKSGTDHFTVLANDHLLVTILLDVFNEFQVPTLLQALAHGKTRCTFCSTERLAPCPEVYSKSRVNQEVFLDVNYGKPVRVAYHTKHIVSDTGRMILAEGIEGKYVESIVGVLHDKNDVFEIEPLVMGAPCLEHPRNGEASSTLMWFSRRFGELLPEDIQQFARLTEVTPNSAEEWMNIMRSMPEAAVKSAFAALLTEPTKKDWGGEANDHFSANVNIGGRRRTAAFLLKGPTTFREMTLDMCGKRADQLYRLASSQADILVVQHSHLIGEAVRETLRALAVQPGKARKYCLIDGQATFRLLRAHRLA